MLIIRRGVLKGCKLTGAVSRAFMARWDRIYLQKVKKAGINMHVYERYVDDSNQLAEISPPNTEYNVQTGKLVKVDNLNVDETEEGRSVRLLLSIANSVQDDIVMEADHPDKNDDNKLPILDMKVWLNGEKFAVFQHYEKPVSNKQVMHSQSALSSRCKESVHVNELIRRILNTSSRLDWEEHTAPILKEYMVRMKKQN